MVLVYCVYKYCICTHSTCMLKLLVVYYVLQDILGWGESDRGVSYTFGRDIVQEFLETHNLSLICRAHQVNSLVSGSAVPHHMQKFSLQFILLCSSLGPRGLRLHPGPAVCPLQYMKSRFCKGWRARDGGGLTTLILSWAVVLLYNVMYRWLRMDTSSFKEDRSVAANFNSECDRTKVFSRLHVPLLPCVYACLNILSLIQHV